MQKENDNPEWKLEKLFGSIGMTENSCIIGNGQEMDFVFILH